MFSWMTGMSPFETFLVYVVFAFVALKIVLPLLVGIGALFLVAAIKIAEAYEGIGRRRSAEHRSR